MGSPLLYISPVVGALAAWNVSRLFLLRAGVKKRSAMPFLPWASVSSTLFLPRCHNLAPSLSKYAWRGSWLYGQGHKVKERQKRAAIVVIRCEIHSVRCHQQTLPLRLNSSSS